MRWLAVACALLAALFVADARASVAIAVTWDGLLHESSAALLATPLEARSLWEDGRIYTYTRVHVDRGVAGELATGADAWVRTMGGVVGRVGQRVEGEAVLTSGESCLLFLHAVRGRPPGAFDVTARAQGQFPVVTDSVSPPHLVRSSAAGALVARRSVASSAAPLAGDLIHGRAIESVARDVVDAWGRTHVP